MKTWNCNGEIELPEVDGSSTIPELEAALTAVSPRVSDVGLSLYARGHVVSTYLGVRGLLQRKRGWS